MNSKQFLYVNTLARCGSFSKAAEALNISQPSLSQYIKKTEEEAGAVLFERTGAYVRLTDAGTIFVETGTRILDLERNMQSRFSDIQDGKSGTLVIGISAHRSVCLMPSIVAHFREKHPGVCVVLKEYPRDELVERAEQGEFDICITTPPINRKVFDVMASFKEEILLAVPEKSIICTKLSAQFHDGVINISVINNCEFVMLNQEHPMQKQLFNICDTYGLELKKNVECSSLETLVSMVQKGLGAALVPSCLRNFCSNGIVFFHIAQPMPKRDIVLIRRRDQYFSGKISDICEIVNCALNKSFC